MKRSQLAEDFRALLFTLPAMVPLALFWFYPLGFIIYLSFMEWDFMSPDKLFAGLQNYRDLFANPAFYQSLRVTVLFCAGSVLPVVVLGLGLALLLNRNMKGGAFYRMLMFSPWVTPTVAVSIVWSWIYEPEVGLANSLLKAIGLEGIRWLEDPNWALVGILLVTIWKSAGWGMIFYLVALRNVPSDLLEAAELDGANRWNKFVRVTLPLISPTTFFLVVVQVIQSLQAYDQINVLTQGGPAGSTRTLLYLYYQSAFESFQIGEASSVAITLVISCVTLSLLSFWVGRRTVHYT
ncbi:glycerol-3-phosphate ABC transporter permease [Paenibacillus macerans]|uniref:carbohydrate ABC transporter permease n=1 Tax=Paenibacillus TaxID=44249 RepID=UPI00097B25D3|nr:sugar ABC transporter permease [Paenibacillus macerans]MED4955453.1 sugar ABC transporter permease [Paenibacillus macerans]OMG47509.1 ABC transporter [Paenibacillus macerans]GJM68626.1 glycerol-3-phosphate ABC transporter permease [Paenibacillus macerans]